MSVKTAQRLEAVTLSAIKEMAMRAAKHENPVSLTWGLPSFRTPAFIRQTVTEALAQEADIGKYSLPDGLPELRTEIAARHKAMTGIEIDPDEQVVATAGNMQGMSVLLSTLLDPGDEVIVTDPGFVSHIQQIRLCGAAPVFWPLDEPAGWKLDPASLMNYISKRTKAIILVSPSNPTGKIFEEAALRAVGRLAAERNILVLLDDPYSGFVYENENRFFNLAAAAECAEHTAYLFTFSKRYAMSGWRAGYMVLPPGLKRQVLKVHDAMLICAPRISQTAALAALRSDPALTAEFGETLERRRNLICERLDALAHIFAYVRPEGAYYLFPRILTDHENARAFCLDLLERSGVVLTPGSAFGPSGESHVRMAYCVDDDTIHAAFDRMDAYFGAS